MGKTRVSKRERDKKKKKKINLMCQVMSQGQDQGGKTFFLQRE